MKIKYRHHGVYVYEDSCDLLQFIIALALRDFGKSENNLDAWVPCLLLTKYKF
jgi:hypothetical protein